MKIRKMKEKLSKTRKKILNVGRKWSEFQKSDRAKNIQSHNQKIMDELLGK